MYITSSIRVKMEHNNVLKRFVPYARKIGLVHFIHTMLGYYEGERNQNNIEKFKSCYDANRSKYKEVYNLLADKESRDTYKAIIAFRQTYKYNVLKKHIYYPQYFVKEVFKYYKDEVFVDGGAYIGDTITELLKYVPNKAIKKIYAWEPDEGNGNMLLQEVKKSSKGGVEIEWIPCALYKEKAILKFTDSSDGVSKIGDNGQIIVNADTIDNRCSDATFIKMDIEGAEIDALLGAKNTIINNKPKLAICIYHSNEHLYEIPLLIHEWVPDYKLYVRHHSDNRHETVLYAVI
jgi:FkbM family methyltransferase